MTCVVVNPLFTEIREDPYNYLDAFLPQENIQEFIYAFPVYFKEEWTENFKVFLNLFETGFTYNHPHNVGASFKDILLQLGFNPITIRKEDVCVINFWRYLTQVIFWELKEDYIPSCRDDRIFAFAKTFPISASGPKVVIVAQDPSPVAPSFGYAFHKCVVPSSQRILNFLRSEMAIMKRKAGEAGIFGIETLFNVDENIFQEKLTNCDMSEWIDQDILLINSSLTLGRERSWRPMTKFLIENLNRNFKNIAFLLVGYEGKYYKSFIDSKRHLVLDVYHPAWYDRHLPDYSYENPDGDTISGQMRISVIDWDVVMPFYKAAEFRFLRTGQVIDWMRIFTNGNDEDIMRSRQLQLIYSKLFYRQNYY